MVNGKLSSPYLGMQFGCRFGLQYLILYKHCHHLLLAVSGSLNATEFHRHKLRCKTPMIPTQPTDNQLKCD